MRVFWLIAVAAMCATAPVAAYAQSADPDLAKPYKPVALTAPAKVSDPGFAAFRTKLGDAVKRKAVEIKPSARRTSNFMMGMVR